MFAISISAPANGNGTNNVIQNCRAELPYGNMGNPFAMTGNQSATPARIITNSKVVTCTGVGQNTGLTNSFTGGGVNYGYVQNCTIDSNTFTDCYSLAYSDQGSADGVQITNNTLYRGWLGVGICSNVLPKQNIVIRGNYLSIQNRVPGGGSYGIATTALPTTNLTIDSNTIVFDGSGGGLTQFFGIAVYQLTGATISNNTIGVFNPGVTNNALGSGLIMFNNRTPAGTLIPTLNNQ